MQTLGYLLSGMGASVNLSVYGGLGAKLPCRLRDCGNSYAPCKVNIENRYPQPTAEPAGEQPMPANSLVPSSPIQHTAAGFLCAQGIGLSSGPRVAHPEAQTPHGDH